MLKTYYLLTKPGIIFGNVMTMICGMMLASKGHIDYGLFLATLIGLSSVIASACVFNNYIDRYIDQKMTRTKNRALARGSISIRQALLFATLLGLFGVLVLFLGTNFLTVAMSLLGFFVYVVLYSIWKRHSTYATIIGSVAGGMPPVVGYCAVSNCFDLGAFLLFMMVVLWQMPHFFAIALYRFDDYVAAAIPVLPVKKGAYVTKLHMLFYIIAFIVMALMLTFFGYAGYTYLVVTTLIGATWLMLCIKGFSSDNDLLWARKMFLFSLVTITALCMTISGERLVNY
jgi:protoheme IX farnesyltransferase